MIGETSILIALIGIISAVYIWSKYTYSYWKRNNVPFTSTVPFVGSLKDVLLTKQSWGEQLAIYYNHPNAKEQPIFGIHIMDQPAVVVREPELIKRIMVKDFSNFSDRYLSPDSHGDALGHQNLFFVKNPKWKAVRTKLTPVFTSGKVKQMFPLITEIGNKLDSYIGSRAVNQKTNDIEIEIKEISAAYSNDVIATVAFGVEVNSFENPNNDFRANGKRIFAFTPLRALEFFVIFFVPKLVKILPCKVFSKETTEFLKESITYVLKERAKSGQVRNDLIDILLTFQKEGENNDFLLAQAAVFFSAGFETSSSTISFAMFELSRNPEIQKKLREEIREALTETGGKITYEMVQNMKLLNKVINETLRLYPSVPHLERQCTMPAGQKAYSLEPFSKFAIPNGMPIYISNFGLQKDSKYFPDPEKFDPERFSSENKSNINPYAYMPFGTGPHNCIGERLGLMQTRVGLISCLRNHFVTTGPRSLTKMVFEHRAMTLQSANGIYVNLVRDPLL